MFVKKFQSKFAAQLQFATNAAKIHAADQRLLALVCSVASSAVAMVAIAVADATTVAIAVVDAS